MIGIIGGTGFIGLNLSWHLQKEGLPCRTFSRNGLLLNPKSIYYSPLTKIEHIKGHLSDERQLENSSGPAVQLLCLSRIFSCPPLSCGDKICNFLVLAQLYSTLRGLPQFQS
jgi:hypothetical protein